MAKQKSKKKQADKNEGNEVVSGPISVPKNYVPRLKTKYQKQIVSTLQKEFRFTSPMRAPRLKKIAINQGVGDAVADRKIIESALGEMTIITGQKPVATHAKKDISNFKLRKGVAIGVKVTLRSDKMYEFLDRFIATALPRIRDFKGISKNGFDGRGNYTLGITEQIIFPEINIDKVNKVRGMDITFVTSAKNNAEAHALLREFGVPFKKEEDDKKGNKKEEIIQTVARKDTKETKKKD
ncbi:MAG: 50S ribosomal protein L5 [Bacteroidetes bacterium]|nr:MAG: 50S ribosomal protein L5 [Bacteroidota bacterium]